MLLLLIMDKFLQSEIILSVSSGSESADVLVSCFCENLPQSVYKLTKSCSRVNTGTADLRGGYVAHYTTQPHNKMPKQRASMYP